MHAFKKVSEIDQEIPQSHNADCMYSWHREEEPQNTYSHKTKVFSSLFHIKMNDDSKLERTLTSSLILHA